MERNQKEEKFLHCHIAKTVTDADWDSLNPNSLETECGDCGNYYAMQWADNEEWPNKLTCPKCGFHSHGAVGSPAGGLHLALNDPRLP